MATNPDSASRKTTRPAVLGRSAATGRFVLVPASSQKKRTVSNKRIEAAVKSTLAKSK
jgi:hypothetical protein